MKVMGVKFTREYSDIIKELTEEIIELSDFYEFFDMTEEDWNLITGEEQRECARTLADDIFYALGNEDTLSVGSGTVKYDKSQGIIKVINSSQLIKIVRLML
jgi:hypothetical protein